VRKLSTVLLALTAALAVPSAAHAYVDPGAGSMLLQLLLGGIAGLFVFFRVFRRKILDFFGFRKDNDSQ
jgi:hypothetical protein